MTTINLKDFYYWYTQDQLIEVSDEVAEVFKADARYEMAYQRRLSRHKAQRSLIFKNYNEPRDKVSQGGVRQQASIPVVLPSCVSPRYAGGVSSYF